MVTRFGVCDDLTGLSAGDYLRIGKIDIGNCGTYADLEYERASKEHPKNPAYNMRPMFYTGSPFGKEIVELMS